MNNDVPELGRANPVEDVGRAPDMSAAGEAVFRDMLTNLKLFMGPGVSSAGWVIAEAEQDGRPVPNAVLMIAQNNTVSAVWYSPEDMENFVQNTMVAWQAMQGEMAKKIPLIVANPDQMNAALSNKRDMDGKFGAHRQPNWPPEGWKK